MQLLTEIAKQRAIYVDGIPELKLPHVELADPRKWPELVEDGAAVVIDEVQRVWRPRGSAAAVPPDVAALETHRHRGLDFFLVTQHPNLLDSNVRRLVGRHVHLRDVGILGRWWYEWPEATNPEQFRQAPVKKRFTLPRKVFGLYKSASLHIKPIRSVPRALIVAVLASAACLGLVYRAGASIMSKTEPKPAAVAPQASATAQASAAAPPVATGDVHQVAAVEPVRPEVVGCFSSAKTCRCFDRRGFPISVEWDLCKTSASSYAGLVPLEVAPPPREVSGMAPPASSVSGGG